MNDLQFDAQGLIAVVVQERASGRVLLLAYMNREALAATWESGQLHLWSRSRGVLWRKGEQSGHVQWVEELRLNCEGNSLLALVRPAGPACHDGYATCFYRRLDAAGDTPIVEERLFDPAAVYRAAGSPEPDGRA
jgi:phosphoribosyl-AMP cyclohydrolase